jgi:hypothetical protein
MNMRDAIPKADVVVHVHSGIYLIDPISKQAKAWAEENAKNDERADWVDTVMVSRTRAVEIIKALRAAGMSVVPGMDAEGGEARLPA